MSAHVQQQLWAHARGQLEAEDARSVDAHLSGCADCKRVFEQFRAAVDVVRPAEPPVLDDAAWSRIDSKVMAAARKELSRRPSPFSWLFGDWRMIAGAGALAVALLAVFVVTQSKQRVAPVEQPAQIAARTPPPVFEEKKPEPEPEPVYVELTSPSGNSRVKVGEPIRTASKLSFSLPDGSRAHATKDASFTVAAASPSEVKLNLERGTLVVAAAHVTEPRSFAVVSGDVEVFVVGTRFLVERDAGVLVVVEEGKVEVAANGKRHEVSAGETLLIDTDGKVSRKTALTPAQRAAFKELPATTAEVTAKKETKVAQSQPVGGQRLTEEDDTEPPVEGGAMALAAPDAGTKFGALTPPPLLVPNGQKAVASSQQPQQAEKKPFDFLAPLRRIDLKNINLDSPVPPVGMPMSEYRVHQLQRTADRGQCDRVVERADAWVVEFGANPAVQNRVALKKAVLFTKARCLTKLGRTADAEKTRLEAEAVK